ncbi:MAG: hypothetical protein IPP59_01605 [Betaproteobacteria bacterium]|nr:hypothetical protein [Candidatus Dechloromonas phosphorivorans]
MTRIEQSFAGDTLFPESIPLDEWRLINEERETYFEKKTGQPVLCRFLQYEQVSPLALPAGR